MAVLIDTVQALRRLISEAADGPNGRLPPERILAQRLGVGRRGLRAALDTLAEEGLIHRRQGQGTFIAGAGANPLGNLARAAVNTNPVEIMEVRLALEPTLARLAAIRASPSDITRLRRLTDQAADAANPTAYRRYDAAFHRKIAESARNHFFLAIYDTVTSSNGDPATLKLGETGRCDKRKAVYAGHHRKIVEAISEREPRAAEIAMYHHLADVQRQLAESAFPDLASSANAATPQAGY